jgi:1-acyl-sn-glycerol-3-phosphate acyltransferase
MQLPRPHRLKVRRQLNLAEGWATDALPTIRRPRVVRSLRAMRRAVLILLWTIVAIPTQAVLVLLPGPAKMEFARIYWAVVAWMMGMRVRVIGVPVQSGDRPVIYVSNHSSWLDIPVLGGRLPGCFVSKDSVSRWPLVGTVARLGRTVFVSRQRAATARERDGMRGRLARGDNLILFPEGTSSDGSRVLPFRSAFFSVAEGANPPLIQPISLVYDRLAGLPMGRANRPVFAWYGDMALGPHFWRLAQHIGCRATVLVHPPLDPAHYPSRKALSEAAWRSVADGASVLRQNRPARPIMVPPAEGASDGSALPAAYA